MAEFVMPILGSDMTEGKLVEWKKKAGDRVARGDIIAEVDTDKATIEIESFQTGIIEELITKPGDTVPVGTVMAIIRDEGKPTPLSGTQAQVDIPPKEEIKEPPRKVPATPSVPPVGESVRLRISPSARQLAAELGVDPCTVPGTGPDSAITRQDIEAAAERSGKVRKGRPEAIVPTTAETATAADRQTRIRQTIAAAMARSKRDIPHYYLSTTIDMCQAMTWLTEHNLKRPVTDRLLYGVLLIKAVALALRQVPELNGFWKENAAAQSLDIHVGVAVSLRQGGLVAPAIHHTDKQPLDELMKSFQEVVKRARSGTLRSSEFSDPTITVTSLGEQGVENVFGVIYPPQVGLVGFGKIAARPWVVDGQVVTRPVITASLSADHRVTDGHRGGLFLSAVNRLLQEPGLL
ncbi:MAG: putative Pyruvate dehydrogenase complex, dihydrolipoamide acetyltransferase component [Nitrospira sp.]|jgi:pyruvate dehydrogenase E2 component (dihydrolipoamide acetyltransferase)|nr:putative Pyruvate dehydrogenase complex, dihydrolipoamide acetyltransferase component [Nitrospira sp.]